MSKESKIGLGVGLGIGLPLVLVLIGAWLFWSRIKARRIPPATAAEKNLPEMDGIGSTACPVPELDSTVSGVGELETRGNAAELYSTSVDVPTELDGQAVMLELDSTAS